MKQYTSDDPKLLLEKKLISSVCLLLSLAMLLSTVFNFMMNLGFWLILTTVAATVIFASLFYVSRFTRYLATAKWLTTLFAFLFINFAWYYNNGVHGPSFFLFIIFIAYLIYFWEKPVLYLFIGLLIVNFFLLLISEYFQLVKIAEYKDLSSKILDTYLGLFIASLIMVFFAVTVKKSYHEQYQRAQRSDELKSLFIRNMSHEIRTPLNAIVGFSELMADMDLQPVEKREYADIISHNSKALTGLIKNIIDVSNLESDLMGINIGSFNLIHLIERQIQDTKNRLVLAGKTDVDVFFHSNIFELIVATDENRLEQALSNILDNAVKFTSKGEISVWCKQDEDKVWIYVRDTGIGIKPENFKIIFDRFVRLEDNITTLYRGTGIGLYLTKEIVRLLGGKVFVESEIGAGSTFYLYFPNIKSV